MVTKKNRTTIYTRFWTKTGARNGKTCTSVAEAEKVCMEAYREGAFKVQYTTYTNYKMTSEKTFTTKKPYWH